MASAPSASAASPLGSVVPAPALDSSLDRLLAELRRRAWDSPAAAARELLQATAGALRAEALTVWRYDEPERPAIAHRHPPRPEASGDVLDAPATSGADREALRASSTGVIERQPAGGAPGDAVLDVGIWTHGALTGALSVQRAAPTSWTAAERAFAVAVADRLAIEALAEQRGAASGRCASGGSRWI
jgi:GAF domain-containing protein